MRIHSIVLTLGTNRRASYADGRMKGPPKACAGNQGTQITVEDMFYNMPQRKTIYKSATEECNRIYDVVSKYAVHNPNVSFTLNKLGEKMILRTPSNASTSENIAHIFGTEVTKHLKPIELNDVVLKYKMTGYYADAPYSSMKRDYLFFFNNRLVDSTSNVQFIVHNYYRPMYYILIRHCSSERCHRQSIQELYPPRCTSIRLHQLGDGHQECRCEHSSNETRSEIPTRGSYHEQYPCCLRDSIG